MYTLISQLAPSPNIVFSLLLCSVAFNLSNTKYPVSSSSSFFFKPDCSFQRIFHSDRNLSDRPHSYTLTTVFQLIATEFTDFLSTLAIHIYSAPANLILSEHTLVFLCYELHQQERPEQIRNQNGRTSSCSFI
jgi:hypothetical protein